LRTKLFARITSALGHERRFAPPTVLPASRSPPRSGSEMPTRCHARRFGEFANTLSTSPSLRERVREMALPLRAGFPGSRAGLQKDIARPKQDCLDAEEIARPYARFMALQEFRQHQSGPRVCREFIYFATVLSETEAPVSRVRSGSAFVPKWTFCGHPSDKRMKLLENLATTAPPPLPT
jgi:hypothetical protein